MAERRQRARSLPGTCGRPHAGDLETGVLSLRDAPGLHELRTDAIRLIYLSRDQGGGERHLPFSTISPTKTLVNPATICATGMDTCWPRLC
jgi:hypothetical protein